MDSVTQIALGAAVGEATLGKKVGNKAVLWGAIAGTIPDLDVIPGAFMETVARMDFHRGISHSILFFLLLSPILGNLISKIHRGGGASSWDWTRLAFWSLFTHALLDCFTTWGTQLFWPFEYRVAINTIFIIDPLYTLPLLVCTLWLLFKKRESRTRRKLNVIGLSLSSAYLLLTLVNKQIMNQNFENILHSKNIEYKRFATHPTPLNNILWSLIAETEQGFYIGYHSFLDSHKNIPLLYLEKNHHLLERFSEDEKVKKLLFLTKGYFTLEAGRKGLTMNDLRFELINGWAEGPKAFVFSYIIQMPKNATKEVIVSRKQGTLEGSGAELLRQFWERIKGI